jgi:hypothetical protein
VVGRHNGDTHRKCTDSGKNCREMVAFAPGMEGDEKVTKHTIPGKEDFEEIPGPD